MSPVGFVAGLSSAVLFAGSGSETPPGVKTVPVLVMMPVALDDTVPVERNVVVEPGARSTSASRSPAPLEPTPHTAPDVDEHVQDTLETAVGTRSSTRAPVTVDGPLFVTTSEYDTLSPGTKTEGEWLFEIDRSAVGTNAVVSVDELSPDVVSVTPLGTLRVAELDRFPVAVDAIVASIV